MALGARISQLLSRIGGRSASSLHTVAVPGITESPVGHSDRLDTISRDYLTMQKEMHLNPNYGVASIGFAPIVKTILQRHAIQSLADYGAGKCNLQKALRELGVRQLDYRPYDPAFPEYGAPRSGDLVCCIDVLEHVEEDFLPKVLDELRDLTERFGFFSVHCGPAQKILPDGRNAHIIQKPSSWWLPKLCERFEIVELQQSPGGFWILVGPKEPAAE